MNDVPLVKANNIHDINTSIIAIKKQLKQLNEAVGLIDLPTIDTSIFVKKSEVVDVVEEGNMNPVTSNAVVPVDEVTSGNMHSVSSNAVSKALSYSTEEHQVGYWDDGKPLYEKTHFLSIPQNGGYSFDTPLNGIVKQWSGNFFQGTVENPVWVMHAPYTYINEIASGNWLSIYVYWAYNQFVCQLNGGGTYTNYYNGVLVITYKYTKTTD